VRRRARVSLAIDFATRRMDFEIVYQSKANGARERYAQKLKSATPKETTTPNLSPCYCVYNSNETRDPSFSADRGNEANSISNASQTGNSLRR